MASLGAHQAYNQISLAKNQHEQAEAFPPGFRFCPLDSELIVHYLQKKVNNEPIPYNRILDVNIYEYNPDYLADQYQALGEDKWYFFSSRNRKYRNGKRPNRAANDGYWKATMTDKPVEHRGVVVGKKKGLVFYLGKQPNGKKTNWLMQEYTVVAPPRIKKDEHDMRLDDWVLCKIYKRSRKGGQDEGDEQIADSVRSTEEEVAQGAKYGDNPVEQNYDSNRGNSYNQQPSLISAPPPFPDFSNYCNFPVEVDPQQQLLDFPAYPPLPNFSNYNNFPADPQQQQLLDFPAYPPHVVDFVMSKYDIPENFESISTMDNLVDPPQLPTLLDPMDPCSYYLSFTENPSPSPFL